MVIPQRKNKDLEDVSKHVRWRLNIAPVSHMDQVLEVALLNHDEEAQVAIA